MLFNDIPVISLCRYSNGDCDGIVAFQYIYLYIPVLFLYSYFIRQARVVKRYFDFLTYRNVQRVIDGDKSFLFQCRVDMHDTIPVLTVRSTQVDDVGVEYLTVFLIERDPFIDQFFSRVGII